MLTNLLIKVQCSKACCYLKLKAHLIISYKSSTSGPPGISESRQQFNNFKAKLTTTKNMEKTPILQSLPVDISYIETCS